MMFNENFRKFQIEKFSNFEIFFLTYFFSNKAIIDRLKVLTSLDVPLSIPRRLRSSRPCDSMPEQSVESEKSVELAGHM